MIIQYYKGPLNIVKVVIEKRKVIISDTNLIRNGIEVQNLLAKDIEKLRKWKEKIKKMTEKEIAEEIRKDLRKENGLTLSSQEVKDE